MRSAIFVVRNILRKIYIYARYKVKNNINSTIPVSDSYIKTIENAPKSFERYKSTCMLPLVKIARVYRLIDNESFIPLRGLINSVKCPCAILSHRTLPMFEKEVFLDQHQ